MMLFRVPVTAYVKTAINGRRRNKTKQRSLCVFFKIKEKPQSVNSFPNRKQNLSVSTIPHVIV